MLYSIAIELKNDIYVGRFPDFADLIVNGDNMADVIADARTMLIQHLHELVSSNQKLPEASELNDHLMKKQYAGCTWAIINLNINRIVDKNITLDISIPEKLHQQAEKYASEHDMDLTSLFISAIKDKISNKIG